MRGPKIDKDMIANVKKIAEKENAIFVKYEPDVIEKIYNDRYEVIKNQAVVINYPHLASSPKLHFILILTLSISKKTKKNFYLPCLKKLVTT